MKLSPFQHASFIGQRVLREGPLFLIPRIRALIEDHFKSAPLPVQERAAPGEVASLAADELNTLRECLYSDMGSEYHPQPYGGRVALMVSTERDRTSVTTDTVERYWRNVVYGEMFTARVSGGHTGMLASPYVNEVAAMLQKVLDA